MYTKNMVSRTINFQLRLRMVDGSNAKSTMVNLRTKDRIIIAIEM